jgi:uncharacterized protein
MDRVIGSMGLMMALVVSAVGSAAAQTVPQQPQFVLPPQVAVTAQGEARFTPDRATISIGVQTRAATAAQASAENARKARAITDTLRAMGIPAERLSTVEYNVFPEQRYEPQRGDSVPRIIGYNVMNTVRVEVHQIQQLGRLIDAALAKGANGINSLQFTASSLDEIRRTALTSAVTRARADAEAIARAGGGQLGELLELSASPYEFPRPYQMAMRAEAADMAATTPISPGEQTATVTIVARWRFVQGAR